MRIILTIPFALVLVGFIPTSSVAESAPSPSDRRMALTRGVDGSFFKGEPITAQWVQDVAGIEE